MHYKGFVGDNMDVEVEKNYQDKYLALDPMNPSEYEDTDTTVICSNQMYFHEDWVNTEFYKEFFKPMGYMYNTDIFFRRDGKIIAVLTLLRSDEMEAFSDNEIDLLKNIQPFLEYTLNQVYEPAKIDERKFIIDKYKLTGREIDVLEYAMGGMSNKLIAQELELSIPTVRTHLQHIYDKVGVHSTNELISIIFQDIH
jgi:DNA-binding CsgD family transcriptional regulator